VVVVVRESSHRGPLKFGRQTQVKLFIDVSEQIPPLKHGNIEHGLGNVVMGMTENERDRQTISLGLCKDLVRNWIRDIPTCKDTRSNRTEHAFDMSRCSNNVAMDTGVPVHNENLYTLLYKRIYTLEKKRRRTKT
jgi:hypothetical protein